MKRNKIDLNFILNKPFYPWEKFHAKTKWKKPLEEPNPAEWPKTWKKVYFKEYPRLDKIFLPKPRESIQKSYLQCLYDRHSSRIFSKIPISIEQISNLAYFSAGLKLNKRPWVAARFYASPGARYSIEVYLISLNSELPKGVFHYNVRSHSLEILRLLKSIELDKYINQPWVKNAGLIFVMTAMFDRNTIKYGVRGYRHIMQEAGHLGQNFYLAGSLLDLSTCAVGGYADDRLNLLLGVDGIKETVVYIFAAGNKGN